VGQQSESLIQKRKGGRERREGGRGEERREGGATKGRGGEDDGEEERMSEMETTPKTKP
jgi:hypothetical protein